MAAQRTTSNEYSGADHYLGRQGSENLTHWQAGSDPRDKSAAQHLTPPSSDISPTSYNAPRLHYPQVRNQRQPLYVPAALRPTELLARPTNIPNRPRAPDTPPTSKDSSFDSNKVTSSPMAGSLLSLASQGEPSPAMSRELTRAVTEASVENLDEVGGLPTTAHWKPDVYATACAVCRVPFSWYWRRHHCRRCGDIICENHSKKTVPLDQNARFHPDGHQSKSCDPCHMLWREVKKLRHSRAGSLVGSQGSSQDTTVPVPVAKAANRPRQYTDEELGGHSQGYHWSTF